MYESSEVCLTGLIRRNEETTWSQTSSQAGSIVGIVVVQVKSYSFPTNTIMYFLVQRRDSIKYRDQSIRVVVIEPGFIDTPMQTKAQSQVPMEAAALSEAGQRYYGEAYQKLQETFTRFAKNAAPPEKVAQQIKRGLTAVRPKTRYTAGTDAKLMTLLNRVLPDRTKDAILGRMIGL